MSMYYITFSNLNIEHKLYKMETETIEKRIEKLEKRVEDDHMRYVEEIADLKNSFHPALMEINKQLDKMIYAVRPYWMTEKDWADFCEEDAKRVKETPPGETYVYKSGIKDARLL
jgi:hypothetical protein